MLCIVYLLYYVNKYKKIIHGIIIVINFKPIKLMVVQSNSKTKGIP